MPTIDQATFVVAVNNREVLEDNFLSSPCLHQPHKYTILFQESFPSAAKAYNDAIEKSPNDLLIFCHQDIYLPEEWLSDVQRALDFLDHHDPVWGVLGCAGITRNKQMWGQVYSSGLGVIGQAAEHPAPVQTLDEIVLILRKSSGLRFDELLPHFHLYGADICLRASERGMTNYAIPAFCIHNTAQIFTLPAEFYAGCQYIKRVWGDHLPIQTTCARITRFNVPIYIQRLRETYLRYTRHRGATRASDVGRVLEQVTGRP